MQYGSQLHTNHETTIMIFRRYETRDSGLLVVSDLGQTVVHFASGFQTSGTLATPNKAEINQYGGDTQGAISDSARDTMHASLDTLHSETMQTWHSALDGTQNAMNVRHDLTTFARVVDERSPGGIILPNTERLEFAGNVATPDEIAVIERVTIYVQDLVTRSTTGEVPGNYM